MNWQLGQILIQSFLIFSHSRANLKVSHGLFQKWNCKQNSTTMVVQALANPMWPFLKAHCSDKQMSKTTLKISLQSDTSNLQNCLWKEQLGRYILVYLRYLKKNNNLVVIVVKRVLLLPTQKLCDHIAICDERQY